MATTSRVRGARVGVSMVLGVLMIALGAFLASRPLWAPPLSGSRIMDMAFAALFLLRGFMNVRSARRLRGSNVAPDSVEEMNQNDS